MSEHATPRAPDWPHWYAEWQAMQDCYVPHRRRRIDLLLTRAPTESAPPPRILDLGCGPGTIAMRALELLGEVRVLGVDVDERLLAMGRAVAGEHSGRVRFECRDLRDGTWWHDHEGSMDLVVSATALHWLTPEDYATLCGRVFAALRPGGWFLNSDHVASPSPEIQARSLEALKSVREAAFGACQALRWDAYWVALEEHLADCGHVAPGPDGAFEGSDDGLPLPMHWDALRAAGFEAPEVVWREHGEAVLAARKPTA